MINFTLLVGFVGLVVPLLVVMMGIVIYADLKANGVDLETEDYIK